MTEGEFLKQARMRAGLTQNGLAKHLRVNGQFVSNIERGKASLPAKHIKRVARLLKFETKELVGIQVREFEKNVMGRL